MSNELEIIKPDIIQNKIHTLRGVQVMQDKDLAELYKVETKYLNKAEKEILRDFQSPLDSN